MFNKDHTLSLVRLGMALVLLAGMLVAAPVSPVRAATLTVTTTSDSGPGSLRQAMTNAASGDTILFAPSLAGQTITLSVPVNLTNKRLILDGSGLSPQVTIDGGGIGGFNLSGPTISMDIYDLTLSNFSTPLMFRSDAIIQNSTLKDFSTDAVRSDAQVTLTIDHSTLDGNNGSAVIAYESVVTITNSVLSNNAAEAIRTSGSTELTIRNSTISNNDSDAIVASGSLTITDSNVIGNNGMGIVANALSLSVINTTIYQNTNEALLINGNGQVTIVNSTISQNYGYQADIFVNGHSDIDIYNSTIVSSANGTIFLNGSTVNVYNSILACTQETECVYAPSGTLNNINSVVLAGAEGWGELADYGGPTLTMALYPSDSWFVDAGDDTICANPPVNNLDQRGVARPYGAHCDIGAFEYDGNPPPTTTTITTSPNPSEPGQPVTATVTVGPGGNEEAPTGVVSVLLDDTVLCEVTLANGAGVCDIVFNEVGTMPVTAVYDPDTTSYAPSWGNELHVVGAAHTITTVTDTPDPSAQGEPVTISVVVANQYGGATPTGTVAVATAAGNCAITLIGGQGSCAVTFNTPGFSSISATFTPANTSQHQSSTGTISHQVLAPPPTVSSIVRANEDPTSAESVKFTVTFSEPVTGVETNDFTLDNATGGISGATINSVLADGTCAGSAYCDLYSVTVNTGEGNGTLRLDVPVDASIVDASGNSLADLPFEEGEFYTVEKTPVYGIGKYDDADEGWTYSGFTATTTTGPYKGTMHYSKAVGNTAEFTFEGSQITLWYSKYSNRGTLAVYLDDNPTPIATLNQYNATRVWQASWTSENLGAGEHTVRLVHASGAQVDIDALEVKEYELPGLGKHDDAHAGWTYNGFVATTTTGPYLGTMHYSKVIGNTAEFTFEGSQITLWYSKYSNRGNLAVYLDDGPTPIATINEYNATRVWQASWTSGNLGAGEHTIKLVHASGAQVDIDALEVKEYVNPGPGKYDDAHAGWTYTGFVATTTTGPYKGTMHYSKLIGDSAEFTFEGSQITLWYSKYSNRGTLEVYIDDNPDPIATIDQYNGTRIWQASWTSEDLGAGEHTVRLVHAGGAQVDIDALTIQGP